MNVWPICVPYIIVDSSAYVILCAKSSHTIYPNISTVLFSGKAKLLGMDWCAKTVFGTPVSRKGIRPLGQPLLFSGRHHLVQGIYATDKQRKAFKDKQYALCGTARPGGVSEGTQAGGDEARAGLRFLRHRHHDVRRFL